MWKTLIYFSNINLCFPLLHIWIKSQKSQWFGCKLKILTTQSSPRFPFQLRYPHRRPIITPPASCFPFKHLLVHIVSCRVVLAGRTNRRNSSPVQSSAHSAHIKRALMCAKKSHPWRRRGPARSFTQLFGVGAMLCCALSQCMCTNRTHQNKTHQNKRERKLKNSWLEHLRKLGRISKLTRTLRICCVSI